MRPRANTLSHLDANTLEMVATTIPMDRNVDASREYRSGHVTVPDISGYQYRGLSTTPHGSLHNLPRLNTSALKADHTGGSRTAPVYGGFSNEFSMDPFAFGPGSTINPNQLHMGGMQGFSMDESNLQYAYPEPSSLCLLQAGESFDWTAEGVENQGYFCHNNESAIETSSPSAMGTNSPGAVSDSMLDSGTSIPNSLSVEDSVSTDYATSVKSSASQIWNASLVTQPQMMPSEANLDLPSSAFSGMVQGPHGTISPKSLLAQGGSLLAINLPSSPPLNTMEPPSILLGFAAPGFQMPMGRTGGASTASPPSFDSSLRHSSDATLSTDMISGHTRSSILKSLLQYPGNGQSPYSQPTMSSPMPAGSRARESLSLNNFPSTRDLQRYVAAYVQYFHPHLPFLHIPSLDFESSEYSIAAGFFNRESHPDSNSLCGGGGCLMLAIAAIGALYEHELTTSKQLFEAAKHLIGGVLEERCRAGLSRSGFAPRHQAEAETTPRWLVQTMLLNVIYGYNCGDKTSANIASQHCATLVSLARGAELARPYHGYIVMANGTPNHDGQMGGLGSNGWNPIMTDTEDSDWHEWKIVEERKRTLYAVFILSSLLVSAYNHPPALTNSEIRLSLPCEEDLWAAESAATWRSMGGAVVAEAHPIMFNAALSHLLTAAQREHHQPRASDSPVRLGARMQNLPESELKPSTFGCLILINALHNYIWETRQRHLGRQWTNHDTEQMHAHIEPALRGWQAAWASNPTHSLERPNPFGAGPLSADCIPLLDLAYVRLFVNLGRSKEAFWRRDFDTMADGLAHSADLGHHAIHSPSSNYEESNASASTNMSGSRRGSVADSISTDSGPQKMNSHDVILSMLSSEAMRQPEQLGLRERHLRKAAFYAADSLAMSDELGISFAEQASRELPLQSAMCAFDCAQVLAEWVGTVQDRIGRYVGVIGSDDVDKSQIASLVLLEDEDRKLLDKVSQVLDSAESKAISGPGCIPPNHFGYGSRILLTTANMLDMAAVWPGMCILYAPFLRSILTRFSDQSNGALVGNSSHPHERASA